MLGKPVATSASGDWRFYLKEMVGIGVNCWAGSWWWIDLERSWIPGSGFQKGFVDRRLRVDHICLSRGSFGESPRFWMLIRDYWYCSLGESAATWKSTGTPALDHLSLFCWSYNPRPRWKATAYSSSAAYGHILYTEYWSDKEKYSRKAQGRWEMRLTQQ